MQIHKLAHCCLVIDLKASDGHFRRILLDPGFYSVEKHSKVNKIDIVLITHEHADHFHIESLKELLKNHPDVEIITDKGVGATLAKEGITHHVMERDNVIDTKGIHIEAYGKDHAILHSSLPLMSNIGFLIQNSFFFPGDAFTLIDKEIDILALPVAGPWMKISEAIDYAIQLKPKKAFPVHDAVRIPTAHLLPERILGANGIEFIKLEEGATLII
jgi:L-ascorbate metabolism protein UlaG (beta-lactamase superfamily)